MLDVRGEGSSPGACVAMRPGDAASGRGVPVNGAPRWPARHVREAPRPYEDEGSVREARGAVGVAPGVWWSVALRAPVAVDEGAAAAVHLRLERHGPMASVSHDGSIDLTVPAAELDAIVTLLAGIVAQARRDGVTP